MNSLILPRPLSGDHFLGYWNGSTNSPQLYNGVGEEGGYYVCSSGPSVSLDGSVFNTNDILIFRSGQWTLYIASGGGGTFSPGPSANVRLGITGLQFYNFDTGLWHTLLCVGNPPGIGWDSGSV